MFRLNLARRFRILAALASFLFLALVAPALAQDVGGAPEGLPSSGMPLVTLIVGLVLGVALVVLTRVAPLTKNTIDDQALAALIKLKPTLEAWADPKSASIPPSPNNPDGKD